MKLTLKNNKFYLNNRPFYIYSGEIHYFRIDRSEWDNVLKKAEECGLNTVSSYIPWCWHEQEEGKFDFTGRAHPQKDLIEFIKKVKRRNLKLVLRIGPICNAELLNEGLPGWLLKKHPDILTEGRGADNLPHVTLISYLNPKFIKYVKKWYSRVINSIIKFDHLIMVQLDNEIGMTHWVNKTGDLSKMAAQMYRSFLKKKYKNIKKLNSDYNTRYRSFNSINQPFNNRDLKILYGLGLFYREYFAKYFKIIRDIFRKKSNIPVLINIPQFFDYDMRGRGFYSPTTSSLYRNFRKYEDNITFGGAYQLRRIDYENFHDIFITTEMVNMINPGNPNLCAELQTGIMRDRPRVYPADVEYHLKTALSSGLKGLNCYMFAGGENPAGLGMFGRYHEWQAPVGKEAELKPHYNVMKVFGQFIKTWGKYFAQTEKINNVNMGFYLPYWSSEFADWTRLENARSRGFYDGIGRLLILGGFHFSSIDIIKNKLSRYDHLIIFTWKWMDDKTQDKLINYVKNGGALFIGPWLPDKIAGKLKINKNFIKDNTVIVNGTDYFIEGGTEIYNGSVPDEILASDKNGNTCAFIKNYGKGKLLVCGFPIVHYFDYQVDILKKWIAKINVEPLFKTEPDSVITSFNKGKNGSFISVLNYHRVPYKVKIQKQIDDIDLNIIVDIHPGQLKILPLNIKLSKNFKLIYSTSEIIGVQKNGFIINGRPGEQGEIVIERSGKIKKKKFKLNYKSGILKLSL